MKFGILIWLTWLITKFQITKDIGIYSLNSIISQTICGVYHLKKTVKQEQRNLQLFFQHKNEHHSSWKTIEEMNGINLCFKKS